MNTKEASKDIGKKGVVGMGGLKIAVRVLDYKYTYGNSRWLITPLAGTGEVWVQSVEI